MAASSISSAALSANAPHGHNDLQIDDGALPLAQNQLSQSEGYEIDTARQRVVNSPKVWATLITKLKYLPGLLALEYSLRRSKTKYPFLVLYTDGLEQEGHEALDSRGIKKQKTEYLFPNENTCDPVWNDCWTKLQAFELFEYERVVLLDSDMLVLQNMDELMDLELDIEGDKVFAACHACVCNPLKKPQYPKNWNPTNCAFVQQQSQPELAQKVGIASSFGNAVCNSGLLVISPSSTVYSTLRAALNNPTLTKQCYFPEQDLISKTFSGRWESLPYIYNALKTMRWCHAQIWRDEQVKNVHYILHPKPWDLGPGGMIGKGGAGENQGSDGVKGKGDGGGVGDELVGWWWQADEERRKEEREKGLEDEWSREWQ